MKVGAVTWASGTTGLTCAVSTANSIYGTITPLHRNSECHRGGAGALGLRVTVRFLHSMTTPQNSGLVPVVRRVASSMGPAGVLLA
jgi:hypothetical protein